MPARKNTNPTAAEALAAPISFPFRDATYTVPATSEWDYETLEAFEDGKIVAVLRTLLGPEQHEAFKATKPKVSDFQELMETLAEALGLSGN